MTNATTTRTGTLDDIATDWHRGLRRAGFKPG